MGLFDFAALRKSVQGIGAQVQSLRKEIESLKRRREDVANAPASRSDVKAAIDLWLDEKAHEFNASLRTALNPLIRKPRKLGDRMWVRLQTTLAGATIVRRDSAVRPEAFQPSHVDAMLCGLFGQQLRQALYSIIDQMQIEGEGLAQEARARDLGELDSRIEVLEKEERDLLAAARLAGVVIPEGV